MKEGNNILKIAIVSDVIYPWTKGGAEIRYHEIYKRLAKKHEIHYYTMRFQDMPGDEFIFEGMHIHCVSKAPKRLYKDGQRKKRPALKFALALVWRLVRSDFDIVDLNQTPFFPILALWFCRRLNPKIKLVATWHEHWGLHYWQAYIGSISGIIGFAIQQVSVRVPDLLFCVSKPTADLVQSTSRISSSKIEIVSNGVNSDIIEKIRKDTYSIPNRLIFVGRLIPEKRVDLFIELVRRAKKFNNDLTAVVIGDGPERNRLASLSEDLNVQFLGFLRSHQEVLKEIAMSSIFISFSEREGFNISALEACQLGLPTYVRVRYFNHDNLHTINWKNLKSELKRMQEKSRRLSKFDSRFSWDVISKDIESHMMKLISSAQRK